MRFTDDLKEVLPDNLTEVVALTAAGWMGNTYERNQHERLCRTLGFADEWVRAINVQQPDTQAALNENERCVQRLTLAVLNGRGHGVQIQLDAVAGPLGAARAMAILMLIGRYVTHALIVNALELQPPVPSIFDDDQSPSR